MLSLPSNPWNPTTDVHTHSLETCCHSDGSPSMALNAPVMTACMATQAEDSAWILHQLIIRLQRAARDGKLQPDRHKTDGSENFSYLPFLLVALSVRRCPRSYNIQPNLSSGRPPLQDQDVENIGSPPDANPSKHSSCASHVISCFHLSLDSIFYLRRKLSLLLR